MNLFQKLTAFLSKGNRANWCLFILFAGTLFIKCVLFHYLYAQSILISSLWKNPLAFWHFYLPRLSMSIAIASILFLFKRKSWIIYISVLLDFWMIANLWYFRYYSMLVDAYAITMIGGLNDGYWSSIIALFAWKDLLFLLLTAILSIAVNVSNNLKYTWKGTIGMFLVALGLHIINIILPPPYYGAPISLNPFHYQSYRYVACSDYEHCNSMIHNLIFQINKCIHLCFPEEKHSITLSSNEKVQVNKFIQTPPNDTPNERLLLIIVESFETWTIHPSIMPHTCRFLAEYSNTLLVPKIKKQTKGGASSDAQLIFNTGLLPIQSGAVSHLYNQNIFPSIADCYDTLTLSISPTSLDDCWKQWAMNRAYHFDVAHVDNVIDSLLFKSVKQCVDSGARYTQVFTIASHTPFTVGSSHSNLVLPNELPKMFRDYIRSINAADKGLAVLLSALETDSILQNTTIVITGDHTILSNDKREQYAEICREQNLPYDVVGGNYVPLIIYSPKIKENIRVDEVCYQMDVYPTIMHLIGCEEYFWKGFGVNLLDSTARHNRPITEEQAYALSDKMIRADYFRTIVDSLNITIKDREPIFEP